MAPTASRGLLATARDGSPRVAFVSGRDVVIARRRGIERWTYARVGRVPGSSPVLAGLVVDARGRPSVLVEAEDGAWLALVRPGAKLRVVARPRKGGSLGPAGLTLDSAGRPAFAYALRLASAKSWLRLVTVDARGRLHTHGITKGGFPSSVIAPGAAPVLVGRTLHVVETYTSAAIDWGPKRGGGWEGQFIFGSVRGTPQGRVGAAFLAPTLWSAWTQVTPELGAIDVVLASSAATQESFFLTHGLFVALAPNPGDAQPEVAANDWIELGERSFAYAGLVIRGPGSEAWQLDGRLDGLAIARDGSHQLLLSRGFGLEWFRAPGLLPPIELRPGPVDASGRLSGSVVGASTGVVQVYREVANAERRLAATSPVGPDGSFTVSGLSSDPDAIYRVTYDDPATGIPFGFLPGVAVGVSG
ncbi:MAG: hypothetical protein ACJ74B_01215 [Gaiellaceae bacterium]